MLVEGEWEWMTSHNLVTFTDWASGEPADFLNQDCLDVKSSAHYHWNDSPCSYLYWFICEKHVYVSQFLILIFVKVLYLKLLRKMISSKDHERSLGFFNMQVFSQIFLLSIQIDALKNVCSNIAQGYIRKLHFKILFLCLPQNFIL